MVCSDYTKKGILFYHAKGSHARSHHTHAHITHTLTSRARSITHFAFASLRVLWCGRWVWSLGWALNDMISGQCVLKLSNLTSLPCFRTFFQLHHDQSSSLHHTSFFFQKYFCLLLRAKQAPTNCTAVQNPLDIYIYIYNQYIVTIIIQRYGCHLKS